MRLKTKRCCGITLTKEGKELLEEIRDRLSTETEEIDLYLPKKLVDQGEISFDSFKETVERAFHKYDTMIFVCATGIVVRTIAPLIRHKSLDPGILVLDQNGEFVIPLLSGHLGRANENARILGEAIGAIPVITTASDNLSLLAVDSFAQKLGLSFNNFEAAKKITKMILEGKRIGLYGFENPPLPSENSVIVDSVEANVDALIVREEALTGSDLLAIRYKPHIRLYKRDLVVGIGLRKNKSATELKDALKAYLLPYGEALRGIDKFSTIALKKDEPGLKELAEELRVKIEVIPEEKIKAVEENFEGSSFVKEITGLSAVAEPAGYIGSNCGEPLGEMERINGITLSVWRYGKT